MKLYQIPRLVSILLITVAATPAVAQDDLPYYLYDRGGKMTTSLFGTFIEEGEWLLYPFYEYYDGTDDYRGSSLKLSDNTFEYTGDITEHEALLFLAYGLSENVFFELEGLLYNKVTLYRDPMDTDSGLADSISEDGYFPALQGQIRWRFRHETESSPEMYTWIEADVPLKSNRILIGSADWEGGIGIGLVKGFEWGTLTPRIMVDYDAEDKAFGIGEWAIEYYRRINDTWRGLLNLEGESTEASIIGELQWYIHPQVSLKLNTAFGLSGDAPKWAPEVGIMFSF